MGKFIPVDPDRWAELVKAAGERDALIVENASLKAEVERLTALIESNLNSSKVMMGKADAVLHERDNLKAEIERLRKAGDGMYSWLGVCGRGGNSFGDDWLRAKKGAMLQAEQFDLNMKNRGWNGWNAAKEGKQP